MIRERLGQMRDRITSQVLGHWWGHRTAGTAVPHLDAALAAAGPHPSPPAFVTRRASIRNGTAGPVAG